MATIEQIKSLREKTGAGVGAIKEALEQFEGNEEKAIIFLRKKGVAKAEKRKDKEAKNGILGTYIHTNSRVVVVVEINVETDFAAKSEDVKKFSQDIALHVAAMNPKYIDKKSVDPKVLKQEREIAEAEFDADESNKKKPKELREQIIESKIQKKFMAINVLTQQSLFTDTSKTVEDYLNELIAKIGEKIEIKQFHKFEVAQDVVACNN